MNGMNRQVVVRDAHDIEVEIGDEPQPSAGEVLIASSWVGICGSDVSASLGHHPFVERPFWPGHEVIGRVTGVGGQVDSQLVGQRVVVEPNLPCGDCELCAQGRYNICDSLRVFGCQTRGGLADHFTISADRVIPLPEDLPDEWAALIEPFSTPVHAVRRAGDLSGRRVVIFGAGPIGLFLTVLADRAGAASVVVGDLVESKRERAVRLGATAAFDPAEPDAAAEVIQASGGSAHVVFDAVSREPTVGMALRELLGKGGRLMTVGVPPGQLTVDFDLIQDRELEITGNLMFVREDVLAAIDFLRAQPFPFEEVVTAIYEIDDAREAFEAAHDPENVKVLIRVGADGG